MQIEKVGLMTPGDMGQAVAMQIKAKGLTVCTALDQRSERSRALAREAGLVDVGTVARLIAECDVVLSIMNPGAALEFAGEAADALRASGRHALIVDCNAIAPGTVHDIADLVERAGGRFLDACIIGPPPRGEANSKRSPGRSFSFTWSANASRMRARSRCASARSTRVRRRCGWRC
jgi:3-hydroxyisobutyrate dehydrogenase-like beta-hydroxyacid dehydrogenase